MKTSASKIWSVDVLPINGPDDLREMTRGSEMEIVQLKPGRLRGSVTHSAIGNIGISVGRFNSEIRVRGALHRERVVLGTILDSAGPVTQWWKDVRPGDVGVFPALQEIDVIHGGSAAYLLVSIDARELASMLRGEEHLADPAFWDTKRVCKINPVIGAKMRQRLVGTVSNIENKSTPASDQAVDFFERSIIETFVAGLISASSQASASANTGARLVKQAEDYVDAAGERPVHISELCGALKVTRRSLHRAFADVLGMGPAAYLRCRRLSAVQSALRRSDPETTSIGDLAFEYGFFESGRFASYYRAHFGETPSETLNSGRVSRRNLC